MQLLVNALIAGSLAALIAGGLSLVFGILGVYNLALGQTVLVGGFAAWWLRQVAGLPLALAIPGGIVAGALLSWLTFDVFIRPFYRRHIRLPLVTTIALGMILDGLIILLFGERPRAILRETKRVFDAGAFQISLEQMMLIGFTLLILALFGWTLHHTAFGRRLRAVAQHDHAALSVGVDAPRLHRLIVVLSGTLAACGGIFIGIDQNLSPTLAFPLTIKAYAAVIAGGLGNVWGAIACAFLIALLEQLTVGIRWFGRFYVPAGYQATIPLLFIIFILLIKPSGLFQSGRRLG
ncbi:MAG: branched-chain amino acid transport system permease protein [Candidatus Peregrinibacteria bacterium Greene0416_19]|nr:MAG: branched-chain amino acid transport system permease protein [Candidatus Peregrinibacteria bacterium Greene0416_19]